MRTRGDTGQTRVWGTGQLGGGHWPTRVWGTGQLAGGHWPTSWPVPPARANYGGLGANWGVSENFFSHQGSFKRGFKCDVN